MEVRIWGTRGSYPVARAEMLRYGGNTTCVEVCVGDTCIILDAGTGLRLCGEALAAQAAAMPKNIHLLITHTHWDHILGFPFFKPLYNPNTAIHIYGLHRTQASLWNIFDTAVSEPLLPIGLQNFDAALHFSEVTHGMRFSLGQDVCVTTVSTNHPYQALGYRIESSTGTLVFVPDTGPFHTVLFGEQFLVWNGTPPVLSVQELRILDQMHEAIIRLAEGADWLIYDAQFTDAQYARFPHWGHSTPGQAMEIAHAAHVRELLLFHHDPHRVDSEIDALTEHYRKLAPPGLQVHAAYEGMQLRGRTE